MGEPVRRITPENQGSNTPYLHLISGIDTSERFAGLADIVNQNARAPKFFGLDRDSIIPTPETEDKRLWFLKKTLAEVPDLDTFTENWLNNKVESIASIEKKQSRIIRFPKNILKKMSEEDANITHIEAYSTPCIRHIVIDTLREHGEPTIAVIEEYEKWRSTHEIPEGSSAKAKRAYEHLLFGSGGPGFLNLINEVAVEKYEAHIGRTPVQ